MISFSIFMASRIKSTSPFFTGEPLDTGMLITNLPGAEMYHEILFAGGHVNWEFFGGNPITPEFLAHLEAAAGARTS